MDELAATLEAGVQATQGSGLSTSLPIVGAAIVFAVGVADYATDGAIADWAYNTSTAIADGVVDTAKHAGDAIKNGFESRSGGKLKAIPQSGGKLSKAGNNSPLKTPKDNGSDRPPKPLPDLVIKALVAVELGLSKVPDNPVTDIFKGAFNGAMNTLFQTDRFTSTNPTQGCVEAMVKYAVGKELNM